MSDLISMFGLNTDQTVALFSMQYNIVSKDIEKTKKEGGNGIFFKDQDEKIREEWLISWKENINGYIHSLPDGKNKNVITDENVLFNTLMKMSYKEQIRTPFYLMILELVLFRPYYEIVDAEKADNEKWKNLEFDFDRIIEHYKNFCSLLGIDESYVSKFKDSFESAQKRISGDSWFTWLFFGGIIVALLAFVFAGPIAALFAANGLHGAAAVAAGMAALGGGAIAAGGFGMAGGMAVIVGGGALLGIGAGAGAKMLFSCSPEITLSQAAKLEVVLKEIVLGYQHDIQLAQEILIKQQEQIGILKTELYKLQMENEKKEDEINNLKKSIEYLEEFVKFKVAA